MTKLRFGVAFGCRLARERTRKVAPLASHARAACFRKLLLQLAEATVVGTVLSGLLTSRRFTLGGVRSAHVVASAVV